MSEADLLTFGLQTMSLIFGWTSPAHQAMYGRPWNGAGPARRDPDHPDQNSLHQARRWRQVGGALLRARRNPFRTLARAARPLHPRRLGRRGGVSRRPRAEPSKGQGCGARDLLALVHAGEAFKGAAGRPQYDHWTVAIGSLLDDWPDDLGREVTISGHAEEPRGVKPSPAVRFDHRCMRLLGEEVTEQACRTILQNLRSESRTVRDGAVNDPKGWY